MKRIVPLALALLLLAACGAEPAEATPTSEPAETVSPTPEPTETSCAVPLVYSEFTLPDPGFEPDSYWLAEGFGDRGSGLLLSRENGGDLEFKCWYSQYVTATDLMYDPAILGCYSFGGCVAPGEAVPLRGIDVSASYSVDGDTLAFSYSKASMSAPLKFYRVSEEEALEAFRNMPYNEEYTLPEGLKSYIAHDELLALPGIVQLDEETYEYEGATLYVFDSYEGMDYIGSVTVDEVGAGLGIRGIKVGCTAQDVLSCFPSGMEYEEYVLTEENVVFYGTDINISSLGRIYTFNGRRTILCGNGYSSVRFFIDDNGVVEAIMLAWPW